MRWRNLFDDEVHHRSAGAHLAGIDLRAIARLRWRQAVTDRTLQSQAVHVICRPGTRQLKTTGHGGLLQHVWPALCNRSGIYTCSFSRMVAESKLAPYLFDVVCLRGQLKVSHRLRQEQDASEAWQRATVPWRQCAE